MTVYALRPQVPAALNASQVGTWELDVLKELCFFDAYMSWLFGLSTQDGVQGVPLAVARTRMQATDQPIGQKPRSRVRRDGSIFVHEFRALPAPGVERWVLARGRFEADASNRAVYARGIAIDITDSKAAGYAGGRISFLEPPNDGEPSGLERLLDAALATHEMAKARGSDLRPSTLPIIELLLHDLNRQLAAKDED